MVKDIEDFKNNYASTFSGGIKTFLTKHSEVILQHFVDAIAKPRNCIYLFGNGGSHAISKCIEYALKEFCRSRNLSLRTSTGLDVHKSTFLGKSNIPGISFLSVLEEEGATKDDLVVLISGSGNSDNLCEVADYTNHSGIPTIAIVGSKNGKLREYIQKDNYFSAETEDQQIGEDIIQSITHIIDIMTKKRLSKISSNEILNISNKIEKSIRNLPADFVLDISNKVLEGLKENKTIYILGADHPTLSICAEHTAHNLFWDGIYQVNLPPQRRIQSSLNACDLSGISNDRSKRIFNNLYGIEELSGNNIFLIFSMGENNPSLRAMLESLFRKRISVFLVEGSGQKTLNVTSFKNHPTNLVSPYLQASLSQALGHILGRVIRMRLIKHQESFSSKVTKSPSQFLTKYDLAQRRLLNA
jgi:D-sedoheptulose 7-phosphate isomerase